MATGRGGECYLDKEALAAQRAADRRYEAEMNYIFARANFQRYSEDPKMAQIMAANLRAAEISWVLVQ